jgi:long-chain acyl-CoA synthetase
MSAVISGPRSLSRDEFLIRARKAAQGFAKLGLQRGDTIALFMRNEIAFLEGSFAANLIGAYAVPINWHATAEEAHYIFENSGARALVAHADLLPPLRAVLPAGAPLLVAPTPDEVRAAYGLAPSLCDVPDDLTNWNDWLENHEALPDLGILPPGSIIYTSGTTGNPKGVRRFPPTQAEFDAFNRRMGRMMFDNDFGEDIVALVPGPMYHSAPNGFSHLAVRRGGTLVIQPRFNPEEFLALVEKHRVTHTHLVPTMFVRLLKLPDAIKRNYDLSSLKFSVHAAAPCPPDVKRAMIGWWGPIIAEYYGSTETSAVSFCTSAEWLSHPGTVGRMIEGGQVRILDNDDKEMPAGETGEVYVHLVNGPRFTYHGDDEKRRSIERDGFITAGDVGYLDKDGFLYLSDRKKDMIISGGVNIYPAEIEAALLGLAGVHDCAVFGIPNDEFGETVCAIIEPESGVDLTMQQVRDYLRTRIAGFKVPRHIEFRNALPREDSGKIFKRKLRAPFWENAGRQI